MPRIRFVAPVLLAGLIALVGCGGGPRLAEVEGTVKVNGKGVEKVRVEFWPEGQGPRSAGETDKDGRFTLKTDDGTRAGAVIGKHRVVLRDTGILGDKFLGRAGETVDMAKGKKPRVNSKFSDVNSTPLNRNVTSGKNNFDLEATP
jgi:hypothetical protein